MAESDSKEGAGHFVLGELPTTMSGWADLYGQNEKTVRRWVNRGREADPPERPPLAAPHEMEIWYVRHHKQACPEKLKRAILQAAEKMAASAMASPADSALPVQSVVQPEIAQPIPIVAVGSPSDDALSIDNFQTHAIADYNRARAKYDALVLAEPKDLKSNEHLVWHAAVRSAKSAYEDERENYFGFLSKVTRIRAEHGKFWSPDVVKSTLTELLSPLASSWRRNWKSRREDLPHDLAVRCPRLASAFAAIPQAEWEEFADAALDEDFAALQSERIFEAIEESTDTTATAA